MYLTDYFEYSEVMYNYNMYNDVVRFNDWKQSLLVLNRSSLHIPRLPLCSCSCLDKSQSFRAFTWFPLIKVLDLTYCLIFSGWHTSSALAILLWPHSGWCQEACVFWGGHSPETSRYSKMAQYFLCLETCSNLSFSTIPNPQHWFYNCHIMLLC